MLNRLILIKLSITNFGVNGGSMRILTYAIICFIFFAGCTAREKDTKLETTLKYIIGGVCLLCLTLLSVF